MIVYAAADARAVIPSDHQAPETPVSVGYIPPSTQELDRHPWQKRLFYYTIVAP